MERIQVFLRPDQKAALKAIAARTGRKQSELIRTGVDLVIEHARREDAGWRAATRGAAGLWKDHGDLDNTLRTLRRAAKRRFSPLYQRS